jgi:hypothetical protein
MIYSKRARKLRVFKPGMNGHSFWGKGEGNTFELENLHEIRTDVRRVSASKSIS